MKRAYYVALFIALFVGTGAVLWSRVGGSASPVNDTEAPQPLIADQRTLTIDRISAAPIAITVEVAQQEEEVKRGLSYRPSLPEEQGMLFLFPTPEIQVFWMYEMQFPLDILFLHDGKIAEIRPNIPPPADTNGIPAVVRSRVAADRVLEINAGKAEEWGLNPGMEVTMTQQ